LHAASVNCLEFRVARQAEASQSNKKHLIGL